MKKLIVFLFFYSCLVSVANAQTDSIPTHHKFLHRHTLPPVLGFVSDFSNFLTNNEEKKLTKLITRYENKTTNEIAVVTLDSIYPYNNIKDFALDLGNHWGVGKKLKNNGLMIVICRNPMEIRVSTGVGTEQILTDQVCKEVLDQYIIPEFHQGHYYKGLKKGIKAFIRKWK
ncbi:MAG TPA: TPM domain-containing protein [Cytophagaceae bacterium]|jgi:uncharacterized protein|nr:TPM domain-containing protein [Cytophagaceae bacterium]